MRKQNRPSEPDVLRENAAQWNADWARKVKVENKKSKDFHWHQRNNQSVRDLILPALQEMNQRHCSFCDAFPLLGQSLEPIEHFKPKITFPEEAFSWSNLYYCCEHCQNSKKSVWNSSFLRPDASDYEFDVYFEFDHTTGQMRPNQSSDEKAQTRARETINAYDLDGKSRRDRRKRRLRAWQRSLGGSLDDESDRDFLEAASSEPDGVSNSPGKVGDTL